MQLRQRNHQPISNGQPIVRPSANKLIDIEDDEISSRASLLQDTSNTYHGMQNQQSQYFQAIETIFYSLYTNIQNFWTLINSSYFSCATNQQQQQQLVADKVIFSNYQQQKYGEFKEFVSRNYDTENEEHERDLLSYWRLLTDNAILESRKSKQWKELGFQGIDPASDFRGAGIFGLQNLLFFVQKYPKKFFQFYNAERRTGEQEKYPFSIAGLNITMMLFEFLGWGINSQKKNVKAKQNFVNFLFPKAVPLNLINFIDENNNARNGDNNNNNNIIEDDDDDHQFDDLYPHNDDDNDNEFEDFVDNRLKPNNNHHLNGGNNNKSKQNMDDTNSKEIENIRFGNTQYYKNPVYFNNMDDKKSDDVLNEAVNIFSELYCIAFDILDKEWYSDPQAQYFNFPKVLAQTSEKLSVLLLRFSSVADVYDYTQFWA